MVSISYNLCYGGKFSLGFVFVIFVAESQNKKITYDSICYYDDVLQGIQRKYYHENMLSRPDNENLT